MQLVRTTDPDFPTTQPRAIPLDNLSDVARIKFDLPIYLDPQGDLWISHPDGAAIAPVLQQLAQAEQRSRDSHPARRAVQSDETEIDKQCHITRNRVVFAYLTQDEQGETHRQVIVRHRDGSGYELVSSDGRIEIGTRGRNYDWSRAAWAWRTNDSYLIVPADDGISIFRPQQRPMEAYQALLPDASSTTRPEHVPPQYLLDARGVLAWIPWDNGHTGSRGAARYVDGKWITLDDAKGWSRIVQLAPLLDGTVLVLSLADDLKTAQVSNQVLDGPAIAGIDEIKVASLVQQLSDRDFKTREAAHAELSRYGPQVWPILEKLRADQPPEGQVRIDQLLRARQQPMLGRMILQEGKLTVVSRFAEGALLYAEAGVVLPGDDPSEPGSTIAPAWISMRSGRPIELAPSALVADLNPAHANVTGMGEEEWFVIDDVNGPQRFLGNHLEPMLRKSEAPRYKLSSTLGS